MKDGDNLNSTGKVDLMAFHFGALEDPQRLKVERHLLIDPELLTDYFDLKRILEAVGTVPNGPSLQLRSSLVHRIKAQRKPMIALAVGLAVAASAIFLFWSAQNSVLPSSIPKTGLLFDSSRELSPSSDVL
jgi:ferric-dicitrate binding protein FerR (iron transport regulator)